MAVPSAAQPKVAWFSVTRPPGLFALHKTPMSRNLTPTLKVELIQASMHCDQRAFLIGMIVAYPTLTTFNEWAFKMKFNRYTSMRMIAVGILVMIGGTGHGGLDCVSIANECTGSISVPEQPTEL